MCTGLSLHGETFELCTCKWNRIFKISGMWSVHASKHTHARAQWSHASVGLAQARPNYQWKQKEASKLAVEGNRFWSSSIITTILFPFLTWWLPSLWPAITRQTQDAISMHGMGLKLSNGISPYFFAFLRGGVWQAIPKSFYFSEKSFYFLCTLTSWSVWIVFLLYVGCSRAVPCPCDHTCAGSAWSGGVCMLWCIHVACVHNTVVSCK